MEHDLDICLPDPLSILLNLTPASGPKIIFIDFEGCHYPFYIVTRNAFVLFEVK